MKKTIWLISVAALLCGCSVNSRLAMLRKNATGPDLDIPSDLALVASQPERQVRDTLKVQDADGSEVLIMRAVRDEDGDMVATDVLDAAMVTARFRNVAERRGRVDLRFRIRVPQSMQDSRWQLRFYPEMYILGDTVSLDPVLITGYDYRKAQLRGYQHYQKFLDKILTDPDLLIDIRQLELFIKRNLPEIYAFRSDTTYVADDVFESHFGVTEKDAVEHYTNRFRRWRNDRRMANEGKMYRRYVKVPLITEGLRLDTVLRDTDGDFIYDYVQTVHTRPALRRVDIVLDGAIYEQDRKIYSIPPVPPITYYISSLSTLADDTERYLTRVVGRKVEVNTACYIDFSQGRADVDRSLGHNEDEISRIEDNLASLLRNEEYDLDSIVVTASASPEGSFRSNDMLARKRSEAVSIYFGRFLKAYRDSLEMNRFSVDLAGDLTEEKAPQIRFISRHNAENWSMLDALVAGDEELSTEDKDEYRLLSGVPDPDARETLMHDRPWYLHLRQDLYPRLRTVRFDFHLHRRGMVQDTLVTTVRDSVYEDGVRALKDRDYARAVTILRPYEDYNAAVAFLAMDYNASALAILQVLEPTPRVNYLLSLLYSRMGEDEKAVQCFLLACRADRAFVHRGNLDPEISALIARYRLDQRLLDEQPQ